MKSQRMSVFKLKYLLTSAAVFPITSPVQKLSYWESQAMLLSIATWFRGTQVEWNEEMVLLGDDHETMRKFCLKLSKFDII